MKHLKGYKVFEDSQREKDLQWAIDNGFIDQNDSDKTKDILADLIDSGFIIDIDGGAESLLTVSISKSDDTRDFPEDFDDDGERFSNNDFEFTYDEVKPDIDELISQLSDKYPKYSIYLTPSGGYDSQDMDEFISNSFSLDDISRVIIYFYRGFSAESIEGIVWPQSYLTTLKPLPFKP